MSAGVVFRLQDGANTFGFVREMISPLIRYIGVYLVRDGVLIRKACL